jgi:catechol 2,3-dioxygenase-like lactoylglutathione lyase family enzyme
MSSFINKLSYVSLAVPGFEAERDFLKGPWGLVETSGDADRAYFSSQSGREDHLIRLRRSPDKRMDSVGFAAPSRASVDELAKHLREQGAKIVSDPALLDSPGGGYGVRFFDNDGRTLEVAADVKERTNIGNAMPRGIPVSLSHVVFFTPDVKATVAFYTQCLGFKVSDWLDDFMVFLRCNEKHHCIAFMKGPASLNHVAFDVLDVDDMMRGMGRLLSAGGKLNWGPGRHTAGDNTFAYFVSPGGNVLEYTAELETVDDATWKASVYPRSFEIIDQWGTSKIAGPVEHGVAVKDPGLWTPGSN